MPDVELARRPDVELVKTGRWSTMTGSWTPTPEDLAAAVEAQDCPAIRRPVVKLGHTDSRFDGEPSLGWFENLRVADDGTTLIGDQVTLPWLHSVQAAAYPSRSVEGNYNHTCSEGHKHRFVLTAVALLGLTPPAVQTIRNLNDLPAMLGVAASEQDVPEGAEHVQVTILAAAEVHTGAMVALIPTAEDAERLAVDGGEPADELHVTLAYLGEAADLGTDGRQDVIDGVSRAANGLPEIEAEAFALSVFNPGAPDSADGKDRDTCIVLGLSGDPIDAVHDLIGEALQEALWLSAPTITQHRPWHCHMTLQYTDDLSKLADLVDRVGPVRFDRIRIALAGDHIDIPLIPPDEQQEVPVAAEVIRARIGELVSARAVRAERDGLLDKAGTGPDVKAAHDPTATTALPPPAEPPASVLPAAEPEQVINPDPKEDLVSTELSGLRSRLGLSDDADLAALEAKVDELKAKAEAPVEPSPEMVAASAAATEKAKQAEQEKDELRKEVQVLASQMQQVTTELSAAKAAQAATVKASVFDAAIKDGKLKPAEREAWEKDYDEAPGAITRVLASIAPGTAVPVSASGVTGSPEPSTDDDFEALIARIDSPTGKVA